MNQAIILSELSFRTSRSSGPGGQHVNKVASKVELFFNVPNSKGLSELEKELLLTRWEARLSKDGHIRIICQATRSQGTNKEKVIAKFLKLLEKALHQPKIRKTSRPSKKQKAERLLRKKRQAEKKAGRAKLQLSIQ